MEEQASQKLEGLIEGAVVSVSSGNAMSSAMMGSGLDISVRGDNYDDMALIANDYVRMLSEYEQLYNVDHNYDQGYPELRIVVNEERAVELGLNVGLIGLYIRNSFEGAEATTYFEEDEE